MRSFRDARRIQSQREITVTGGRLAVFFMAQALVAGAAFGGGYWLRGDDAPRPVASARPADALGRFDAEDVRADYRYQELLTAPAKAEAISTAAATAMMPKRVATTHAEPRRREGSAKKSDARPAPRARAFPGKALAAARSPRAPDVAPEADEADVRALEARLRRHARESARTRAPKGPIASTDDELTEAIGESAAHQ